MCRACAATCYVPSSASGVPLVLAVLMGVAGALLAAHLRSAVVLALAAGLTLACYVLIWRRLRPVAVMAMSVPPPARSWTATLIAEVLGWITLVGLWK